MWGWIPYPWCMAQTTQAASESPLISNWDITKHRRIADHGYEPVAHVRLEAVLDAMLSPHCQKPPISPPAAFPIAWIRRSVA